MTRSKESAAALSDWLKILESMDDSISDAIQSVDRRLPADTQESELRDVNQDAALRSKLDATVRGLENRFEAARELALRIESMLDRDEREVRAWRATADAVRERLAASGRLS